MVDAEPAVAHAPEAAALGRLVLPYPPSTNRYWRHFRGRMVPSSDAAAFKNAAGWLAQQAGLQQLTGRVAVSLTLHPVRPQRWKPGQPTRCIDLDNCLKVALDALNGIAWGDDSQVVRIVAQRADPVPSGALVVEVYPC